MKEEETKEKGWRERDQEGSNEVGRERMEVGRRKEENKEEWGFFAGLKWRN